MKIKQRVILDIEVEYDEESYSEEEVRQALAECIDQGIGYAYNWSYDYNEFDEFNISDTWE